MTSKEKQEEAEAIKNWNPRYKRNVIIYLLIYGILGAFTGITNDAALSYHKIVAPQLISSLNIFNAATAILMSLMIATVHKLGYRKILLILPPMMAIFMALTCVTSNEIVIMFAYTISWTAIEVYDLIYPLMWTSYVPGKIRTNRLFLYSLFVGKNRSDFRCQHVNCHIVFSTFRHDDVSIALGRLNELMIHRLNCA